MGENAKRFVMKNNNPEDHYMKIMEVYRKAIKKAEKH